MCKIPTSNKDNSVTQHDVGARKLIQLSTVQASAEKYRGKSFKELSQLAANEPALIVIEGKVYDLALGGASNFLEWHPGGLVPLSQVGRDGTGAFQAFHTTKSVEAVLASYYVGDLEDPNRKPSEFLDDLEALRELLIISGYFESDKQYYMWKLLSTLALGGLSILVLAFYGKTSTFGVLVASLLMGLFFQQCGWFSHDLIHCQVFESRFLNKLGGYFIGNVCQGFAVSWWMHKHDTHHSVPNIHGEDEDIDTLPFLAWSDHALEFFVNSSDTKLARFLVSNQPVLFFPILAFARSVWCVTSVLFVLGGMIVSPAVIALEVVTMASHWIWYLTVAFRLCTPIHGLLFLFLSQMVAGLLLAIVFSVNHNGMPVMTGEEADNINFYELQIRTSRDIHWHPFIHWFMGSMDFQIEHHMFPEIPRHHLPKCQPLVESLCKKHSIPYHRTNLFTAYSEVLNHLAAIAKNVDGIQ